MADSRPRRRALAIGLAFAGAMGASALVGGLLGGFTGAADASGAEVPLWLLTGGAGVAMALGLWACLPYWRRIDEMAREAHKSAWFWGGSFGMGVVGAVAAIVLVRADEVGGRPDLTDPDVAAASGVILAALVQLACYAVAWAVWWLRRRG